MKLYHGTNVELEVGDFLEPRETGSWKSNDNRTAKVCATPFLDWAEKFAFRKCLNSKSSIIGNGYIILFNCEWSGENLNIYEVDNSKFVENHENEWVSEKPVKILKLIESFTPVEYCKRENFDLYLSGDSWHELNKALEGQKKEFGRENAFDNCCERNAEYLEKIDLGEFLNKDVDKDFFDKKII